MTSPHTYPRRILLAVTGLSPQIVTETLYALAHREPAFVPTEIRLVTTLEGAERARLTLLDPEDGAFHALCRDYGLTGIRFDAGCITVIGAESGAPLADIRSPEENARAADTLLATVRELTADPQAALHVSIAGGRKTMGFYLGYCLSLCARPQDRLSHVLVSEPFESHPQFFFPPARGRVLYTPRDNRPVHTGDARVTLADIPFVRLRRGVPEALLADGAGFGETVAATEEALPFPELRIDLARRELCCGGRRVPLPPQLLAWYAWMARSRKTGAGFGGEPGHCRWTDAGQADFLEVYRQLAGALSDRYEAVAAALAEGFPADFFAEKNAKVNGALVRALGPLRAAPYRIVCSGAKPHTRYGLSLAPDQIEVG